MKQKKIAIICYSYSDGFAYMEQKMAKSFVELGMEVLVICSTANRIDSKKVVHVNKGEYESNGYRICRLPFISGGHLPDHKMPIILKGMYARLDTYEPDIIYHMSCSAINLLSVRKYMKNHPRTELFVDNHASMANSANNFFSKVIQHKIIYKTILHRSDKYIKKYFYVGQGEKSFLEDFYNVDKKKCFFFSLGDFAPDDITYKMARNEIRKADDIGDDQIVITYSGKFTKRKKTIEIIQSIIKPLKADESLHFYLVGSVQDETIKIQFDELVNNTIQNFRYLGWKNSDELKKILCGTDIYIQYEPSSTFQTALCCRAYGITGNLNGTYDVYPSDVFGKVETIEELVEELKDSLYSNDLYSKRLVSYNYARIHLDYINQIKKLILE